MKDIRAQLYRIASNTEVTIAGFEIDCSPECFIVEDEFRTKKVMGETRIPSGSYEIKLRCEGGHYNRYREKYPDVHKTPEHGMLCITNADDWKLINKGMEFQYVLMHVCNDDDDTMGCLLTNSTIGHPNLFKGKSCRGSGSVDSYKKLYKKLSDVLLSGKRVFIDIYDEGQKH